MATPTITPYYGLHARGPVSTQPVVLDGTGAPYQPWDFDANMFLIDSALHAIAQSGGGAVTSVAGKTGAVVLVEGDIGGLSADLASLFSSVSTLATAISNETARAEAAELVLTNAIAAETSRAEAAEGSLIASVSGTANQITVTSTAGAAVVSLPTGLVLPGSLTMNSSNFILNGPGSSAVKLQALTAAVAGTNQSPSFIAIQGNYWDGAASQSEYWSFTDQVQAGTSAGSILAINHTFNSPGSTGPISVKLNNGLIPFVPGSIQVGQLVAVAAPTITPVSTGSGGNATTYSYVIEAVDINGFATNGPNTGTTTTASATLDNSGTQQNNLAWAASIGAASYRIYRTVSNGTPSTVGLIGTATTNSFSDTGQAGNATVPGTVNQASSVRVTGGGSFIINGAFQIQLLSGVGIVLSNNSAAAPFIALGQGTSSFVGFQRSGTKFNIRLGNNSADATLLASVIQSSVATGTAPFIVASTTVVANLNVSQLLGATWASPGAIGGTTAAAAAFTTLSRYRHSEPWFGGPNNHQCRWRLHEIQCHSHSKKWPSKPCCLKINII